MYLNKNFNEMGTHDYLINKLYDINLQELEYYLPELCYIIIKKDSVYLERFLLHLASKDYVLYQKVIKLSSSIFFSYL
jgi:phosphatidylinositol 4-kinase